MPAPTSLIDRAAQTLARFPQLRLAVVGDAMLDRYLEGTATRLSPEAPVPVVRLRETRSVPGGAANVAMNARATGAMVRLVAAVGRDDAGRQLAAACLAGGVALEAVSVARPTTTKTRIVAGPQQVVRVDEEDDRDLTGVDEDRMLARALAALDGADAVILEDYDKGALTPVVIRGVIQEARARGVPVVVDPKHRHMGAFRGATVLKPNRGELAAASGWSGHAGEPDEVVPLASDLGVSHLLVTLGADGMLLVTPPAGVEPPSVASIPAYARAVADVVGAGDTVSAYLALALGAGMAVTDAALLANAAAAVQVSCRGTAVVRPDQVLAVLRSV